MSVLLLFARTLELLRWKPFILLNFYPATRGELAPSSFYIFLLLYELYIKNITLPCLDTIINEFFIFLLF